MPTPLARSLLHPADDALLTYLEDDGLSIEPEWYVPVIPLILVNGADGIGTGAFSHCILVPHTDAVRQVGPLQSPTTIPRTSLPTSGDFFGTNLRNQ